MLALRDRSRSPLRSAVVESTAVVILAAGRGTRMRSELAKVLHPVCGVPMVEWTIRTAREVGADRIIVVQGPGRELDGVLPDGVETAIQENADGTAGALEAAVGNLEGMESVVVLAGDVPLVDSATVAALLEAQASAGAAATIATMVVDDPSGYGRVVRSPDGTFERVVETKNPGDASPEQMLIDEVNTGLVAFRCAGLGELLAGVGAANAQGERYLPDALSALAASGELVEVLTVSDSALTLGVNDRADLAKVAGIAQARINEAHMRSGVSIIAPQTVVIDADVEIAPDACILSGSVLRGATRVGPGAVIGPNSVLDDAIVDAGAEVSMSRLVSCRVGEGATVGPFAYLRPGADLGPSAKAGTFVEIKNSSIGEGAKVPHLSYVGDADVGARANLGASTITANYDGRSKHRTTVGEGARTGVHTSLVAPVEIGDGSVTGAGSTITDDVPDRSLGIARQRQTNIDGYADRSDG